MQINLWKETIGILKEKGKNYDDVLWIGNGGEYVSKDDFMNYAANLNYDNGYGSNKIPMDIVIVGDSWWLERAEYDGSEWWEFKCKPNQPMNQVDVLEVFKSLQ